MADTTKHSGLGSAKGVRLVPFEDHCSVIVAGWVRTEQELRWLAPATGSPLTPEKVLTWQKPGGNTYLLANDENARLLGYAELNPVKRNPGCFWLGHVVMRPDERGKGLGDLFVRLLLQEAWEVLEATAISLIVFPENDSAVRCYLRTGFVFKNYEYHRFGNLLRREKLLRMEITKPRMNS